MPADCDELFCLERSADCEMESAALRAAPVIQTHRSHWRIHRDADTIAAL